MFKLKTRSITVLTDEQASLVAGGATVKVVAAKNAIAIPGKAAVADDSATGDFCVSIGCTSDNCDSYVCTSTNCDSDVCDSFGCASDDGCYSAECDADSSQCPSNNGQCS